MGRNAQRRRDQKLSPLDLMLGMLEEMDGIPWQLLGVGREPDPDGGPDFLCLLMQAPNKEPVVLAKFPPDEAAQFSAFLTESALACYRPEHLPEQSKIITLD